MSEFNNLKVMHVAKTERGFHQTIPVIKCENESISVEAGSYQLGRIQCTAKFLLVTISVQEIDSEDVQAFYESRDFQNA